MKHTLDIVIKGKTFVSQVTDSTHFASGSNGCGDQETFAISYMTQPQAIDMLRSLADALGYTVMTQETLSTLTPCPKGFETVVGYTNRLEAAMSITEQATFGRDAANTARTLGVDIRSVDAPQVLQKETSGRSITSVLAYPTWVLDATVQRHACWRARFNRLDPAMGDVVTNHADRRRVA
jgi:hypothetical protein